ncbi:methyltransferase domain-containing protein [uncultured Croceitalea sp.]|uniref:methyltransferase domain-containing protein n=1 Tax=uncultured Croceitalea sp. TaxID=1798908 RepID=UPI00374F85A8
MEQIYKESLWGNNNTVFYSGEGSHNPIIVDPYVTSVSSFLKSFKNPITICDLGCGDFNVGKQLVRDTKKYIAIDIVQALITHNKQKFKVKNLEFQCLDIAKDKIPEADCAILRQVLQHLSNTEVQEVVSKLSAFTYIILTEHLPERDFIPNKDIISGQGIRFKKQSGINLLAPPFNFKIKEKKLLSSITLDGGKGVIETILYKV